MSNETDDIRRAAVLAMEDAKAAGITSEEDRKLLLPILLQARLGNAVPASAVREQAADARSPQAGATPHAPVAPDAGPLDKIASELKVSLETIESVFATHGDDVELVVSARKFASDNAGATRQIAQLVCTGRQAAGIEEWTASSVVRAIVADYGKLDSNNFAAHLQRLDEVALLRGKGATREIKISKAGKEKVAEFVAQLAGEVA